MSQDWSAINTLGGDAKRKAQATSLSFYLLAFWLFWLYVRPEDLITTLRHVPIVIAILCFLLHLVDSLGGGKRLLSITPLSISLTLLTVWALMGIPFSFWVEGSVQTFYNHWVKMLLIFCLLGQVVSTVKQLRAVAWVCILGAAFVASVAMVIHYTIGAKGSSGRLEAFVSGPYSGSNYLSIAVLLMLPFVLMGFFVWRGMLSKLWAGILCFVFATANLLTQSRAGAVAMIVILFVAVFMLKPWGKSRLKVAGLIFLAGIPLIAIFGRGLATRFAATAGDYDLTQLGTGSVFERTSASTHKRLEVLLKAIRLTVNWPVMGVGMGNFSGASAKTWATGRGADWVAPHNTYLQYSAELGVAGLLLYLFVLYSTFKTVRGVRRRITTEMLTNPDHRILALLCDGITVSLVGYMLTSIFASVAYNSYFFFLAGLAQSAHRLGQELPEVVIEKGKKKKARKPAPEMWGGLEGAPSGAGE